MALGVKPLIPEFLENNLGEGIFRVVKYVHSKKRSKKYSCYWQEVKILQYHWLFNDENSDVESITMVYREPFTSDGRILNLQNNLYRNRIK